MKKLATKRTYKNKKYNKPHLAKKLDKMASNIAKRGVFITVKTDPGFNVINYLTKEDWKKIDQIEIESANENFTRNKLVDIESINNKLKV